MRRVCRVVCFLLGSGSWLSLIGPHRPSIPVILQWCPYRAHILHGFPNSLSTQACFFSPHPPFSTTGLRCSCWLPVLPQTMRISGRGYGTQIGTIGRYCTYHLGTSRYLGKVHKLLVDMRAPLENTSTPRAELRKREYTLTSIWKTRIFNRLLIGTQICR